MYKKKQKRIFKLPSRGLKNDKYMFENSQYDDSGEIINSTQKKKLNLKIYSSQMMSFWI